MIFLETFFLNESGLFDFDLTFVAETLLFILLSLVVTFAFISPITKQLDERAEFINYNLRKSNILLTFGYEKLITCVNLLTEEINEMNRQLKMTKSYTNSNFEDEIIVVQQQNTKLLSKLKGDLSIKSVLIFSNLTSDLLDTIDYFFEKRFNVYN
jgi:hypothetical protein